MNSIMLKNCRHTAHIGLTEEERKQEQEIVLDIELFLDFSRASQEDDIGHTIDYSDLNKKLKEVIASTQFRLIERLAQHLVDFILNKYPIKKIIVELKKPGALDTVDYASVKITQEK